MKKLLLYILFIACLIPTSANGHFLRSYDFDDVYLGNCPVTVDSFPLLINLAPVVIDTVMNPGSMSLQFVTDSVNRYDSSGRRAGLWVEGYGTDTIVIGQYQSGLRNGLGLTFCRAGKGYRMASVGMYRNDFLTNTQYVFGTDRIIVVTKISQTALSTDADAPEESLRRYRYVGRYNEFALSGRPLRKGVIYFSDRATANTGSLSEGYTLVEDNASDQ